MNTQAPPPTAHLIGDIYEATLDPQRWAGVLSKLARTFNSHVASLQCYGAEGTPHRVNLRYGSDPEIDQLWISNYLDKDPWPGAAMRKYQETCLAPRRFGAFTGAQCIPYAEVVKSPCYQDIYRHLELDDWMGAPLRLSPDSLSIVVVNRSRRDGLFSESERRQYEHITGHMVRAFRIQEQLALASLAGRPVLDSLRFGIVLLRPDRSVVTANLTAEELTRRCGRIAVRNGRLACVDASEQAHLVRTVAEMLNGRTTSPGVLVIRNGVGNPVLVLQLLLLRQVPEHFGLTGCAPPLFMVVLAAPRCVETQVATQMLQQLGLTEAEAAICARVAAGFSLSEISDQRGATEATVRKQFNTALQKLNLTRQSELVALVRDLLPPVR